MASQDNGRGLGRREFLKLGAMGAGAAGLGGGRAFGAMTPAPADGPAQAAVSNASRLMGRTGMRVNVIGMGTLQIIEEAVIQAAIDLGVNYIDTARVYLNGRSEEVVGKAVRGRRDKVYIATKTPPGAKTKQDMFNEVEKSLKAMSLDYIDVMQVHCAETKEKVMNPELREALTALRDQGKIRYVGVTTHKNQAEVLNVLADDPDKFYDMALVSFNYQSGKDIQDAVARAGKAGVGVVAMKTQQGGYQTEALGKISPHQASLRWVLQFPEVSCTIPGMVDILQLRENLEVANQLKLARAEEQLLERYAEAVRPVYCGLCGECEPGCPRGVQVSAVNRSLMYADGYRDLALAQSAYGEIPKMASAAVCGDCGVCTAKCVRGLDIAGKMQRAREIFA